LHATFVAAPGLRPGCQFFEGAVHGFLCPVARPHEGESPAMMPCIGLRGQFHACQRWRPVRARSSLSSLALPLDFGSASFCECTAREPSEPPRVRRTKSNVLISEALLEFGPCEGALLACPGGATRNTQPKPANPGEFSAGLWCEPRFTGGAATARGDVSGVTSPRCSLRACCAKAKAVA